MAPMPTMVEVGDVEKKTTAQPMGDILLSLWDKDAKDE